jgi:spore coat polysaccharide biosynthesis protein SpsF
MNPPSVEKPIVTVIIQARMDSTRLPNKAMLDLAGKPLLAHVIERSKSIKGIHSVVLATGNSTRNSTIIDLAESMDIHTFCGSDDNVLDRYVKAAERFGGDYIVRVTGDNPFTDPLYASHTVQVAISKKADICSPTNLPLGTAVEIIKREALLQAHENSNKPYHFEHVTPYIKENQESFIVVRHDIQYINPFPGLRLTVDEQNDYRLANAIYSQLYKGYIFTLVDVLDLIGRNIHFLDLNKSIHQRTMTDSALNGK